MAPWSRIVWRAGVTTPQAMMSHRELITGSDHGLLRQSRYGVLVSESLGDRQDRALLGGDAPSRAWTARSSPLGRARRRGVG